MVRFSEVVLAIEDFPILWLIRSELNVTFPIPNGILYSVDEVKCTHFICLIALEKDDDKLVHQDWLVQGVENLQSSVRELMIHLHAYEGHVYRSSAACGHLLRSLALLSSETRAVTSVA
mmetsp:Transcript_18223/g.31454  ORF Transcript_18223/g.31454 Transcript_18223/m.31454 type:complete len:119 (-) Transcript_18223:3-359(-)